MTLEKAEMIANCKTPFELNHRDGDDVTIVSDTAMDPVVWSTLNEAARSMGIEPTVVLMSEREFTYAEPTPQVAAAMAESDYCLLPVTKGLLHSDATCEAMEEAGTRMIAMSEVVPETLAGGAAAADFDAILERARRVKRKWTDGSRVAVSSPAGTELRASIDGRPGLAIAGKADENADVGALEVAFPDGEAPIAPVEGTAEGTLVWDTSMHEIGRIDEPIRADVEDGHVTAVSGGAEAAELREILRDAEATHGRDARNVAEISVGVNPGAEITGRLREDKKAFGYLHVAVGGSNDFGGAVDIPFHVDGVLSDATLRIDDEVIVEDGDVVV